MEVQSGVFLGVEVVGGLSVAHEGQRFQKVAVEKARVFVQGQGAWVLRFLVSRPVLHQYLHMDDAEVDYQNDEYLGSVLVHTGQQEVLAFEIQTPSQTLLVQCCTHDVLDLTEEVPPNQRPLADNLLGVDRNYAPLRHQRQFDLA